MKRLVKVLLPFVLAISVSGQTDLIPENDSDLEMLDDSLQKFEAQVFQCKSVSCPDLKCEVANSIWDSVSNGRDWLKLYAFWISRLSDFRSNSRAQERYSKASSIVERMTALVGNGEFDRSNSSALNSCIFKLEPSCGEMWSIRKRFASPTRCSSFYCKVVFPSSGEPSEGTASQPERWREALEYLSSRIPRSMLSPPGLSFEQDFWIEYAPGRAMAGISHDATVSVSRCDPKGQELTLVPANIPRTGPVRPDQRLFSKQFETGGEQDLRFVAPYFPGAVEFRLQDLRTGYQLAFAPVLIDTPIDVKGKWISNKGEEIEIVRSAGLISAYPAKGRVRNALIWDIEVTGVDRSGTQSFSATCSSGTGDSENLKRTVMFVDQNGEISIEDPDCKIFSYGNRFRRVK
ncbi:MAG: hypothetical protein IPM63_11240 [Acidobacteriota bacterium]|nr:MAG: hypothetical protein IPM63_11240 [Acidobacteriota bacterium]